MTALEKDPFMVQYIKVDDIIDRIMSLGRGTLLAKFDVESAYRITPVHPNDRYLWIWSYLLVCVQRLTFFLHLGTWRNGSLKKV